MTAYRSPILQALGVFEASGADRGVAAHYGEPLKEQRRLVMGSHKFVAADFSHSGLVVVTGPDRLSWVTTLSSQVLEGMQAADSCEFLLLTAQGRIDFAVAAVEDGQQVWLLVEGDQAQRLTDYLQSMQFMLRVEVKNLSANYAVLCSHEDPRLSPQAPELLKTAVVWQDPWSHPAPGAVSYAQAVGQDHPGSGYRRYLTLVDRAKLPTLLDQICWVGSWAVEALRVEAWRPRYAREVDGKALAHELDYMRTAVHLNKGCYKGQETVARVHNLGRPPRRLVFLDLDGSEHTLPAAGAAVYAGQKKVGHLTSVAQHWEAGPIALALIKRAVAPDQPLRVLDQVADQQQEYAAEQTLIVSPEAGRVAGPLPGRAGFLS